MPEMHLKQPALLNKSGFTYVLVDHLINTKKEFRNLKKREIIYTKMI